MQSRELAVFLFIPWKMRCSELSYVPICISFTIIYSSLLRGSYSFIVIFKVFTSLFLLSFLKFFSEEGWG